MSIVAGLRGATSGGIGWDLSVSTGENSVDHNISNTVNASLGPDSPTSFSLGTYTQRETNLNFDLTYAVSERVSLAGGGVEWRNEEFEIGRGQPRVVPDRSAGRPGLQFRVERLPRLQRHRGRQVGPLELRRLRRRRDQTTRTGAGCSVPAVRFEELRGLRHHDEQQDRGPLPGHGEAGAAQQSEQRLSGRRRRASRTRSTCRRSSIRASRTW